MFLNNWKYVWNNDLLICTANKLAALTGARCSEIFGIKGEFVFSLDGGETPVSSKHIYDGLVEATDFQNKSNYLFLPF